jgi:phage shock protein PspC (stress-responsive transcriptional regulator)
VGLYRDLPGRVVGGVTAAVANHFNWDVSLVRVAFVISFSILGPIPLWAYLAVWLMTPFKQDGKAPLTRFFDWVGQLFSPPQGEEKVEQTPQ